MPKFNRAWRATSRKSDSVWEDKLAQGVLKECGFHDPNYKVSYSVDHVYNPDFSLARGGKVFLIESKGRFMDTAEASKYIWVRGRLNERWELVFLFYNPKTPMPFAKKRKDGTKLTHGEWATKNGFKWYTEETIKELLNGA